MSEQKVWVEKMPENCDECPCSLRGKDDCAYCNLLHKNIGHDFGKRPKHCLLINIKDHDRELVRQVCKKIIRLAKLQNNDNFYIMTGCIIDEIRKEFEDE